MLNRRPTLCHRIKWNCNRLKYKTHTYNRGCSPGRKQDCTISLPKVGMYRTSSQSGDVAYLFSKQGCTICLLKVEMYHTSSQSRTVSHLFFKQDCAISHPKVGMYHICPQSRTVPYHFPKQGYTTPLPKLQRYHISAKTRTLPQFLFNICPLVYQCLLGSLPCIPPFDITSACFGLSVWISQFLQNNRKGRYWQ